MHAPTRQPYTAVPLPDWVQRARVSLSQEDYFGYSIAVASKLTHHLAGVLGTDTDTTASLGASFNSHLSRNEFANSDRLSPPEEKKAGGTLHSPLLLVQMGDIVLENVQVFVSNKNHSHRNDAYNDITVPVNFIATEVIIQPNKTDAALEDFFDVPQISQREGCFALGKILFELFSDSSSQFLTETGPRPNEDSIRDLQIGGNNSNSNGQSHVASASMGMGGIGENNEHDDSDDFFALPALKRAFLFSDVEPETATKAMRAKESLLKQNLPPSICQLISDLLDAEEGNPYVPDTAILSLDQALSDLVQMESFPERFLADHSCPKEALDKTALFCHNDNELYGREKELNILMNIAARVCQHVPSPLQRNSFLCEAAFIAGHSGSGKSSLTKRLVSHWNANDWTVIHCKFDRQAAPLSILLQSFDTYFEKFTPIQEGPATFVREPSVQAIFDRVSRSIISSVDNESFTQLCRLLPRLGQLFPMGMFLTESAKDFSANAVHQTDQPTHPSSPGIVGSGRNRLLNMLHVLFNSVCSGGKPVLVCVEDLQWVDASTFDIICNYMMQSTESYSSMSRSIMLLGNFRDDEVSDNGFLMNKIRLLEQSRGSINVTRIFAGELQEKGINEMLSFKFCLLTRHTRELAQLVFQKTRGHPLFVIAFLQSMIQGNLITFSVKARRWTWDDTTIDLQMISENVVEFLMKKLKQLPSDVIETLKVASCFGQINLATVQLLDLGQFVPNMLESLESAMEEGIIERAGPVFAFSHDMLQESSYNLVPINQRKTLHKTIAMSLVQDPEASENADMCTLAVDQINVFKFLGGVLSPAESSLFAQLNLAAGKYFMSTKKSNYGQARGYFEAGISMLHANHWDKQYSTSLELYECSVTASFMDGKLDTVSSRLDAILSNARSLDDSLNSRMLLAKYLASQEQYTEATQGVLEILSQMGVVVPKEINESLVMNEINEIIPMLKGVTKESILSLPIMTDQTNLHAMKFMDLLTSFNKYNSPMLMHVMSCRMTKLTFSSGFSDEYSKTGLLFLAHGIVQYSISDDNIWLATQICRTAESLIKGSPNEHSLRARLSRILSSILWYVEPLQAVLARCLEACHSAKTVGDSDNAIHHELVYCAGSLFFADDLVGRRNKFGRILQQLAKRQQIGVLHSSMLYVNGFNALIGNNDVADFDIGIKMKSNKELYEGAEQTQNSYHKYQLILIQMHVHCYFREYLPCADLARKHQTPQTAKRSFEFLIDLYSGISALNLARDTNQAKWREVGEKAVQSMTHLAQYSSWNFENKQLLLRAELNYLNGHYLLAELAYEASIASAREHKFINEEALAHELFGVFLMENKKVERGIEQLELACNKYMQWGAFKKAWDIKDFVEIVTQANCALVNF